MAMHVARIALIGLVALFIVHTCEMQSNDLDTSSKSATGVEQRSSLEGTSVKKREKKLDKVLSLLQGLYSQVNTLERRMKDIEKQQSEIDVSLLCSKRRMYEIFYHNSRLWRKLSKTKILSYILVYFIRNNISSLPEVKVQRYI